MKKKMWKSLAVATALATALAGCSSGGESGQEPEGGATGPKEIGNEVITIRMAKRSFPDIAPEPKDLWMWKEYEKMSNVKVDWIAIPDATVSEKKNLMMSSGDYPEAFFGSMGFSSDEVVKYGAQGIFLPLEELIEQHAPNLKALFAEYPEVKKAITAPDGHIYSLPYVDTSIMDASLRYYINNDWLTNLGLKPPETLDEFTEMLKKFRDEDANGNGDPNDEYPMAYPGNIGMFEQQLFGSFGMGNGGLQGAGQWIYKDTDGQIKLIFTDEKYREVWKYMAMLWKEKLMHPETFTNMEYGNWVAAGAKSQVGVFSWVSPSYIGDKMVKSYIGVHALEGPGGRVLNWLDNPARGTTSFMITDKNKNPERTIKWIDFWYGEEGANFGFFGKEGVTYNIVDGKPKYIDEIANYEGGQQLGALQYVDNVYGGYYPYLEPDAEMRRTVKGMTMMDEFRQTPEDAEKYATAERWPRFMPSAEESAELIPILTDINQYISEARVKFVTGEWDINGAQWDDYVKTLNQMGAERYLEIKKGQYERYANS
ncbi:ABC transporter substrate-binding protein [Paenibacillus sp. 32O-W]|uniref:extracellular solute-binding protein n=1 Tax=Paenibacillus sp. 32O-W TaxID=1695218 RepID=UPI000721202F|nr:extracellular solute-binding protein [Paenibacillus sp. 32O-W]ALS29191.1 ABC transporter substrate-binding protein [Paenibacillus sp. 32O-W]